MQHEALGIHQANNQAHREGLTKQEAEVFARPGYYNDHASTLRGSYETGSGSLCARLTIIMTKHIERVNMKQEVEVFAQGCYSNQAHREGLMKQEAEVN